MLTSLIVIIVNVLLKFIIRSLSKGERHETQTKMNVSVAFKLTIARFINSALVLVFVNENPANWYKGGDLVYDATVLIIILAIQAPLLDAIYIPGLIKKFKIRSERAKGEEC